MTDAPAFSERLLPLFAPQTATPVTLSAAQPSYIRDHRQRLRARFLDGGAQAVPDY
ncbi:DNA repair protein RadC [Roseovarius tolerans]|uniref:DNA repair protein RadC n=1 Tax=Roseovarius tolerans TaxID=74031 RepID=A0A1H7WR97_9RHOB|nr:DNA repair protein RadC [Roseovarius tolerans]